MIFRSVVCLSVWAALMAPGFGLEVLVRARAMSGSPKGLTPTSGAGTLEEAVRMVREARRAGDKGAAVIYLPEGVTEVMKPVVLGAEDSDLVITAEAGVKAVVMGAPVVTGWTAHEGKILKADAGKVLPKGFLPKQLLFGGERQILARYPNFDAKDPLYGGWAFVDEFPPSGAPEGHRWKRTLYVKEGDLRTWTHPEEVEIDIFAQYGWWNFVEPVASLDPKTRLLTLGKDCGYDLHPNNRYHFQNALEELDAPGEWFYDRRSGMMYFWPPEAMGTKEVRVPVAGGLIQVKAGAKKVMIRGLTFTGCEGTAITFENAEECEVTDCVVTTCGGFHGSGISVSAGRAVKVARNEVSYTGSNGIGLSGGDRKTLTGPGHVAEDNHIHHMGVFNKNACGISMYGVDNRARHNHIHDGPRMGVQMSGNNLIVEYNHMHHLVLETQDGGAIYTGGRDWISSRGSKWRYNLIHDVVGCGQEKGGLKHPWFSFGLYPDDNTGGLDIIGNIVYRIAYTPIHMHNARDCVVENNVFALGGRFQFDLHGWSQEMHFWKDHLPTMVKGYESVAGLAAWKGMRGMELHPKDAFRPDGTMMSGNVVRRNIMFGNEPGVKHGDLRHCSPEWNVIDENVAWNGGHPIVTGINKVGPDKGEPVLVESFETAEAGKTPKGWGFNHKPNKDVQLVVENGALRADCAVSDDPKNPKTVFHGPDVPMKPGAAYRVRLKVKSSEPEARLSLAFAAYQGGAGYWQANSNSIVATNAWKEVEATGRIPRENEAAWKAWMTHFWLRVDCHEGKGQVWIDDVRIVEAEPLNEWAAWQEAGWDRRSVVADPMFVDWEKGDWRLRKESPAWGLGWKEIPVGEIGVRAENCKVIIAN